MFATTRIPGLEIDEIKHWDPSLQRHVAVLCRGRFYFLNVYTGGGRLREPAELEVCLREIKEDAASRPSPRQAEASLTALTALPRSRWASIRGTHFSDGQNRRSLEKLESALLFVYLDTDTATAPDSWSARGRRLIHGSPKSPGIWFDKSISLTFFTDGKCGVNAEHSWADAPVIGHLLEEAMICGERGTSGITDEGLPGVIPNAEAFAYFTEDGHAARLPESARACIARKSATTTTGIRNTSSQGHNEMAATPEKFQLPAPPVAGPNTVVSSSNSKKAPAWGTIPWSLPVACEEEVAEAVKYLGELADNFDLTVVSTLDAGGPGYGKDFIKKCSVSPDAFIQAAMQLAYFRDVLETDGAGRFDATYESSMTRLFKHGRTETVRPVTKPMKEFVRCMQDEGAAPGDKLSALQRAAEEHVNQFQAAMCGGGIDRHLFGLFCISVAVGVDSPFLKHALSVPWKLSTSQQPQGQTDLWDIKHEAWKQRISPGGGFGPVSPEGYGVSYMVSGEKEIFFRSFPCLFSLFVTTRVLAPTSLLRGLPPLPPSLPHLPHPLFCPKDISAQKTVDGKPARTNVQRFQRHLFSALTDMKNILPGLGKEKKGAASSSVNENKKGN